MDLGAVFLLLAILVLVVFYVVQPLTRRQTQLSEGGQEMSTLMAEHERILDTLQELDFDFSLGKIPAEDYPSQRQVLVERGVEVLRRLDALAPALRRERTVEERLEAKIAERRAEKEKSEPSRSRSDEELEEIISHRRSVRKDKIAGFCPQCGKPILGTDVFCSSCGKRLK